MLVTVNNSHKFEIKIVHDLSCHPIAPFLFIYLFIYYETRTKLHEKEKNTRKTQTIENIQKNTKKTHITKNTSHGAYIVHN